MAVGGFQAGERRWIDGLGHLRNVIRQEMIARQLADHVTAPMTVLDVGCGQGTQAIRIAALGCQVVGVEPSDELRRRCADSASASGMDLELIGADIARLDQVLSNRRFDLVCAHGLLMYLDDRAAAIDTMARRVAPEGRLSLTFRNAHALAMRPALRGNWTDALAAFDSDRYVNELGVPARADRLEDVEHDLDRVGMSVVAWYGVRVFTDAVAADTPAPSADELAVLLDAEDQGGRRDPYRWMGSQIHVVARPH